MLYLSQWVFYQRYKGDLLWHYTADVTLDEQLVSRVYRDAVYQNLPYHASTRAIWWSGPSPEDAYDISGKPTLESVLEDVARTVDYVLGYRLPILWRGDGI